MGVPLTSELIGSVAAVVVPVAGLAVAYMRLSMSDTVRGLKLDLMKELNGTYIRRGECMLSHGSLSARVDKLEGIASGNAGRDYHTHQTREQMGNMRTEEEGG